jgi:hypothetical protein
MSVCHTYTAPPCRASPGPLPQVRRIALLPEVGAMSLGAFLQLSFGADQLEVFGRAVHMDHVRYLGMGRVLACIYQDRVNPCELHMPPLVMQYFITAQLVWLKQEAAELCQEANEAFDVVEGTLHQHPFFEEQLPELQGTSLGAMIAAGRKDRSSFVDRVTSCVRRASPTAAPGCRTGLSARRSS